MTAGMGSPVRTASSHSSWLASAAAGRRDQVTHAQGHHVAGDQLAHVQALLVAVAPDQGLVANVGMQRGDRQLERYSLMKPSPTLKTTIAAMMTPSVGSPVAAETPAAASNRMSMGCGAGGQGPQGQSPCGWPARCGRQLPAAWRLRRKTGRPRSCPAPDTTLIGLWAAAARWRRRLRPCRRCRRGDLAHGLLPVAAAPPIVRPGRPAS